MKVLFVITNYEDGAFLSEITHPYWHLAERGVVVDFASPKGGKVSWSPFSDPYAKNTFEPEDIVSKGFLSDKVLTARLESTLVLRDVDLSEYDGIHIPGGMGPTYDLYPNDDVAKALEYFWAKGKVVGAICHGAIALANIPERIRGRRLTGYPLAADLELERLFGKGVVPQFTQSVLEGVGALYEEAGKDATRVIVDGKLLTGQNQQSASEYGIIYTHMLAGGSQVIKV
jgi:putative intracellular protease/amidase